MSNLSLEQLEAKLARMRGPQMPGDVEGRIRQRLAASMTAPVKPLPWYGVLGAQPGAVWAQVAALVALVAAATALLVGDLRSSAPQAPAAVSHAGATAPFAATFMVPSIKSGAAPAQQSAPQMIAPPGPPPRRRR